MLNLLIKPLLGVAGQALNGVIETRKAKAENKLIKIKADTELMNKQIQGEIDYDIEAIKGGIDSLKDEWLTLLSSQFSLGKHK